MSAAASTHSRQATSGSEVPMPGLRVQVRRRLRERAFWVIQAGVLGITVLHVGMEASGLVEHHEGLLGMLAHLPVVLYLLPVSYAGFRYGFEGSILTGVWTAVLAVPNLFVWHRDSLEWLGELLLIAIVVGIGVLIAVPVEREQRQRRKAEAASRRAEAISRRLALLNELSAVLLHTARLDDALRDVLHRLLEMLPLQAAALVSWTSAQARPSIEVREGRDSDAHCRLETVLAAAELADLDAARCRLSASVLAILLSAGDRPAALCVDVEDGHALGTADLELLATVAAQVGVALDNARLHRLNQERLVTYVRQVTSAQEEERRRIARELHDVATHELLLLCRELDTVADFPPSGEQLPERVQQLRDRAAGIVEYLRRFSRDLRPAILDTLGLAPALRWLTTQLSKRSGIETTFQLHGQQGRLNPEVELAMFRIVQEALRNAERHADARRITVSLRYEDGGAEVDVTDNGSGFDVPARLDGMVSTGKLGLLGMRERAQLAGGRLWVDSRPGAGTRIHVTTGAAGQEDVPGAVEVGGVLQDICMLRACCDISMNREHAGFVGHNVLERVG